MNELITRMPTHRPASKVVDQRCREDIIWPTMGFQFLDPRTLQIDASYQRGEKALRIRYLAAHFDADNFGVVIVGRRADGSLYVIDGQHRVGAALALGLTLVPCMVRAGSDRRTEAKIFVNQDNRKKISTAEKLHARCAAGDEKAAAIQSVFDAFNLTVSGGGRSSDEGYIECIGTVEDVYDLIGVEGLKDTLGIVVAAWGTSGKALHSVVVRGIAAFWKQHGGSIDKRRLVRRLQEEGVGKLTTRANGMASSDGGHQHGYKAVRWFSYAVAECYNRNLRTGRLDPNKGHNQ